MKSYSEFISRNWLLIDENDQQKIKKAKILLVGVGMGSQIAEVLVRLGFENFIIADGDTVSLSNLNRQNYDYKDIGTNKAKAIKSKLKSINNNIKIKLLKRNLYKKDLLKYIPQVDYVINTIDFDSPAFVACSDICRKLNKKEIFPINLGFGAAVMFFDKESPTFSSFFGDISSNVLKLEIVKHCIMKKNEKNYLHKSFEKYLQSDIQFDPQNVISTYISSAVVASLILLDLTSSVNQFPYVYHMDAFLNF